jgi:hypothetical protein
MRGLLGVAAGGAAAGAGAAPPSFCPRLWRNAGEGRAIVFIPSGGVVDGAPPSGEASAAGVAFAEAGSACRCSGVAAACMPTIVAFLTAI